MSNDDTERGSEPGGRESTHDAEAGAHGSPHYPTHPTRAGSAAAASSPPTPASSSGSSAPEDGSTPPTLPALTAALREFAAERDWEQFHTPKNLAMALAGEAGELVAEFQWLTPEQSANLTADQRAAVAEEMADVLIYLCRLADVTGIDLLDAAERKLESNRARYTVDAARGNAEKVHKGQ